MKKAQSQRAHAKQRALERYNLSINRDVLRSWVKLIQDGAAEKLQQQSLRVAKYKIAHEGKSIIVIYDRHRKTIVTCLPNYEWINVLK